MFEAISWVAGYWSVLIWIIPFLALGFVARIYLGNRIASLIGSVGLMVFFFTLGRKTERDKHDERVRKTREEREKAYEEIVARDTDRDDVLDRLRRNDF